MMTWLPFCIQQSAPLWKTGYGATVRRRLDEIEGVVDHSMEGGMAGAWAVLCGPRQASWHFSIPKDDEPFQHYPVEDICWHAGTPGDRKFDTSIIGNLTLVGKEYEGGETIPWTASQLHWGAKIDVALREICPHFAANPPKLKLNQWEHRWLTSTSCPSGRNLWHQKFELIREMEGEMSLTVEDKIWIDRKINEKNLTTADKVWIDGKITKVIDAVEAAHVVTRENGGGGLSAAQVRRAVKDALKEGTEG